MIYAFYFKPVIIRRRKQRALAQAQARDDYESEPAPRDGGDACGDGNRCGKVDGHKPVAPKSRRLQPARPVRRTKLQSAVGEPGVQRRHVHRVRGTARAESRGSLVGAFARSWLLLAPADLNAGGEDARTSRRTSTSRPSGSSRCRTMAASRRSIRWPARSSRRSPGGRFSSGRRPRARSAGPGLHVSGSGLQSRRVSRYPRHLIKKLPIRDALVRAAVDRIDAATHRQILQDGLVSMAFLQPAHRSGQAARPAQRRDEGGQGHRHAPSRDAAHRSQQLMAVMRVIPPPGGEDAQGAVVFDQRAAADADRQ